MNNKDGTQTSGEGLVAHFQEVFGVSILSNNCKFKGTLTWGIYIPLV
jgi:hypothetical protein